MSSSTLITIGRREKLSNWMKSNFSSFGRSQNSSTHILRMDKKIMELIKEAKTMSEKEAIVDSASQFTLALLFALSSSVAVLCNTYDHYKDLLEVECCEIEYDRKREALQMIQYQFSKIYDLKQACQSMVRLFRNIGSRGHNGVLKRSKKTKKRRLGRASSNTEKTVRYALQFVSGCCRDHRYLTDHYFLAENSSKSRIGRTSFDRIAYETPLFHGIYSKESFMGLSH